MSIVYGKKTAYVSGIPEVIQALAGEVLVPVCEVNTYSKKDGVFSYKLKMHNTLDGKTYDVCVVVPNELTKGLSKKEGQYGDFVSIPNPQGMEFQSQLDELASFWKSDIVEKNRTVVTSPMEEPLHPSGVAIRCPIHNKQGILDEFLGSVNSLTDSEEDKKVEAVISLDSGTLDKKTQVVKVSYTLCKFLRGVPQVHACVAFTGRRKRGITQISQGAPDDAQV